MEKNEEIKSLLKKNAELIEISSKKSDIVSTSAHQIRTSLSAIKWIVKMFIDGDLGKLNTEQENLMKKAYEDNERAIRVINELLLVNKNEDIEEKEYNFTKVDLIKFIDDIIFDLKEEAHAKKSEIIFLKPESEIKSIRIDEEKMRIVFQNLLDNAIKYSNSNGKIFITLKEKSDFIEFSIKDVGICISEEGKHKIFEKFFRDTEAKNKKISGSGIGLFSAKQIIENHNGKIWFESNENEGTTFFFSLPIVEQSK